MFNHGFIGFTTEFIGTISKMSEGIAAFVAECFVIDFCYDSKIDVLV
jgi:hypothetical protein